MVPALAEKPDMDGINAFLAEPRARRTKAISLTPLIDVVFILLLFFMVTSAFTRQKQLELASPVASSAVDAGVPQLVYVDELNNLRLWGEAAMVADEQLAAALDSAKPVVLVPASSASVQTLVTAMARLKGLGIVELSLGKPSATNGAHNSASSDIGERD
ncbi:MAG: ExbD/TolR family protein [Porticoccaceae bacterium]